MRTTSHPPPRTKRSRILFASSFPSLVLVWTLLLPVLLLTCSVQTVQATTQVNNDTDDSSSSSTTSAPCNSVLGIFTLDELRDFTEYAIRRTEGIGSNETQIRMAVNDVYMNRDLIQYDLLISKACSSCQDLQDILQEAAAAAAAATEDSNNEEWLEYCGPDVYGYQATYSALVVHPLDPTTGERLTGGVRNAIVGFQGTQGLDLQRAYTELMAVFLPANATERENLTFLTDDLPWHILFGASAGLIGIGIDYMGTGESAAVNDLGRYYLTALPVRQAAVVGWYAARQYVETVTLGCTRLGSQALTIGYSWGGAAVIFGSLALERQGITIVRCFSQSGVYSNVAMVQAIVGQLLAFPDRDVSPTLAGYMGFTVASFSNEAPFLVNTGTGQRLMSPEWLQSTDPAKNILGWVYEEKISPYEMRFRFPTNATEALSTLNPNLIGPIVSAGSTSTFCQEPHVTASIFALCGALYFNEPSSVMAEVNFPLEWCHSTQDPTIPYAFSQIFLVGTGKANVFKYEPIYDFLEPMGDHGDAERYCKAAVSTFLSRDSSILLVTPITTDEMGMTCPGMSLAPTITPTMMPIKSPATNHPTMEPGSEDGVTMNPTTSPVSDAGGFSVTIKTLVAATAVVSVLLLEFLW